MKQFGTSVMTEKEANNYLYGLWEDGQVPSNFDENHSDYEKAVMFLMKKGSHNFNYDTFLDEIVIIKFGDWRVEWESLEYSKEEFDYIIECDRFWETRLYEGHLVWDWLIHLTSKAWINKDNVKDFNLAFFFCQDYFKEFKPEKLKYVSIAQTLNIQQQILEIRDKLDQDRQVDEYGLVQINSDDMHRYNTMMGNINFL